MFIISIQRRPPPPLPPVTPPYHRATSALPATPATPFNREGFTIFIYYLLFSFKNHVDREGPLEY